MPSTPPRRGRPPRLTREAIVAAALALLDEQGLEGLSMRGLAGRLGVDPMALYRHVDDKDALLAAVCDAALSDVGASVVARMAAEDLAWRPALELFAIGMDEMLAAHPGLVPVLVHAPITSLGVELGRDLLERCQAGGLPPELARTALATLFAYVIGNAVLAQSAASQTDEVAALRSRDPEDPALRMWDSDALDVRSGIATVLDGIEARAARISAGGGRGRARR